MEVGANEIANSDTEPVVDRPETPIEPADEQSTSELLESCPPRPEVPPNSEERIWEPKCSRCVIFRDNAINYLRILAEDLSPRMASLEALKPEINMLKKLNAELTTQLEESIQSDQTSKARAAAAEEETAKVKEALESLEKDYYGMSKAAEEGKKHAHEANVWRVKYEKTVEICDKIQEKRKKESANFDKVLNLAEGYKKELDLAKKEMQELKGQYVFFVEAHKKYVPGMYALMRQIVADPSCAKDNPSIYSEFVRLCSPEVKKSLRLPKGFDEDDDMSNELERLINETVTSQQHEPHNTSSAYVAEGYEHVSPRPESVAPSNAPIDFVLSELNEEEADDLLEVGAEAATVTPAVVHSKRTGGVAKARGGGTRRGQGFKQTSKPSNFAASIGHDELNRRFNEVLESKLRRTIKDVSEPCSSGVKHMSIHGKKTLSVREQQEAQMKVSIKEKVAAMKLRENSKKADTRVLDGEVLFPPKLSEIPESVAEVNSAAEFETTTTEPQNIESTSPAKSKSSYSFARNDLFLSESPSPASSIAEGETNTKEFDVNLLALEEFGNDNQQENSSRLEAVDESVMVTLDGLCTKERELSPAGKQEAVAATMETAKNDEARAAMLASPDKGVVTADISLVSKKVELTATGEHELTADLEQPMKHTSQVAEEAVTEQILEAESLSKQRQVALAIDEPASDLPEEERSAPYEAETEHVVELEVVSEPYKEVTANLPARPHLEYEEGQSVQGTVSETIMENPEAVKECYLVTTSLEQDGSSDETQNGEGLSIMVYTEEPPGKDDGPSKTSASVLDTIAAESVDNEEIHAVTTLDDASSRRTPEMVTNAEGSSTADVLQKDSNEGNGAFAQCGETAVSGEMVPSNEALLQLMQETENITEEGSSRDSPKPHLAKDTKRALGLMRRLEDDLKGKVEPIQNLCEVAKNRSGHEGQSTAEIGESKLPSNAEEASADVASVASLPGTSNSLDDANNGHKTSSDVTVDAVALPDLDSKILEKDHEEAMRLHAELNCPRRRLRKDSEKLAREILDDFGAHMPSVSTEQGPRRNIAQTDLSSIVPGTNNESRTSRTAIPKETSTSNQTYASDMMESILAGAHMGPANPSATTPVPSVKAVSSKRHSNAAAKSKSIVTPRTSILDSPAPSQVEHTIMPQLKVASSKESEAYNVTTTAGADVTQRKGRVRPKHAPEGSSKERKISSKQEDFAESPDLDLPVPRTRARSRSSLTSPPLSRRSSRKSSNEEVSAQHEAKNEKTAKIAVLEPHETRAATRRRTASIKSQGPSRSSRNELTEEKLPVIKSSIIKNTETKVDATNNSRKRAREPQSAHVVLDESLSVKKLKSLSSHLQVDSSSASRPRGKTDTSAGATEALELQTSLRRSTRTRPLAPKKRKSEAEHPAAKEHSKSANVSSETDDEDRLCVVAEDEEEEQSQQINRGNGMMLQKQSVDEHVEDEDDEDRLIVVNEEDEKKEEEAAEMQTGEAEHATESTKVGEEGASATGSLENVKGDAAAAESSSAQLKSHILPKIRRLPYIEEGTRNLRSSAHHAGSGGMLQAARRSLPSAGSGIAAMQRVSSRISKQLQRVGSGSNNKTRVSSTSTRSNTAPKNDSASSSAVARKTSARSERTSPATGLPTRSHASQSTEKFGNSIEKVDLQPPKPRQTRGSKRKLEETTTGSVTAMRKVSSLESVLEKKLHGALLSEQTIEVIRKNLGDAVELIAQMDPVEFASTMIKCSLNLPSGDMWTIIQTRYRESESEDVHNKKEDTFIGIAKKLAGSDQIWLEYVKKMIVVIATQIPNAVSTTRYIRLLCQGLHQAGNLLTSEEKQNYIRAALTRLFFIDTSIAMKATIYVLLSSAYKYLAWLSNKDDPFSVLLSLAVTTYQNDGKIIIWAWFQRFSKELQLHDVTPENLRKSFDDLLKRLGQSARERGCHSLEYGSNELSLTQEETQLLNIGISYLMPIPESLLAVKGFVGETLRHCMRCVETALKSPASGGTKEYSDAFVISSQLRFSQNLIFKAITFKENTSLSRDFFALLQEHVSEFRELCSRIDDLVEKKPWMDVYLQALQDFLNLLQTLTQYEIA